MKLRAFLRYLVLQVPEAIVVGVLAVWLGRYLEWPAWIPFAVLAAWIAKDLALYPFVRRVFEEELPALVGPGRLVGEVGVAAEEIAPLGYVRVRGELWKAESADTALPIAEGSHVKVHEVRGLTLLVSVTVLIDA